jgi:fructose-bisphosphate aldolase class I
MAATQSANKNQRDRMLKGEGFIAALDQSGGSTPKALKQYGIDESAYSSDAEMFAEVHKMRTRVITTPAFSGDKIIGAILFEKTMDATIEGIPTAKFLWEKLNVVPFLKIDQGLADEKDGCQMMKPIAGLDALLERAVKNGVYGTKMRSVIKLANEKGIADVIAQQFEIAKIIIKHGLVPIIEPEVDIHSAEKAACEKIMKAEILKQLGKLASGEEVMLKVTLPEDANFYSDVIAHKNMVRVVALSGGYDLDDACRRLAENNGMIASFSRALTNDLRASQSDAEFDATLRTIIEKIYKASVHKTAKTQAA